MPTLKLGSTTALTESSGALTINVANPTVTLGSNATFNTPNLGTPSAITLTNATFPAGHVIQVVRHQSYSYTTSSGTTEAFENMCTAYGDAITCLSNAGEDVSELQEGYDELCGE